MGDENPTTEIVLELPTTKDIETSLELKVAKLREIIQKATQYTEKVEVKDDEAEKEALTVSGRMLQSEKRLKSSSPLRSWWRRWERSLIRWSMTR